MENDDFEKILTVKEFDRCSSFYSGLLHNMKKSIVSNFLIKFILPENKTLEICAVSPLENKRVPQPETVDLQANAADIEGAILFLMQQKCKFSIEDNILKTCDPAGNGLRIAIIGQYDPDLVKSDQKTEKVKLS